MSIFRKKATVIAGLFCAVAFCFSLGLSALKPTKVEAATTMPAATTVEDLLGGSITTIRGYAQQSTFALKALNTLKTQDGNTPNQAYFSNKAEGEDAYSYSEYAGNLSYWTTPVEGDKKMKSILFSSTDKESVISFRTVAQERLYFMGDMADRTWNGYSVKTGGWTFVLDEGVASVSLNTSWFINVFK